MRVRKSFLIWTIALAMVVIPTAIGQEGSVQYVHDPSIIKQADTFYVFSTGHGIPIRRSTNLYDWENIGSVFKKMPDWMPKLVPGVKFPWAPDISFFNGRYHLYYSVSTFGSNKSAIGLATNKTLDPQDKDYKWVDQGPVLQSQPDSDDWNAIDPNVILDEKGQLWMSFGSFWGGIKLCRLNLETGKRADEKLFSIASRPVAKAIEAPFIIHMKGFYYLFVSFDFCCRGADSTYKIMVGRSKKITGPYYDRAGWPLMKGGGTLLLSSYGNYRGPGHNAILIDGNKQWLVHHFYDANTDKALSTLQIRPLLWADDNWPLAGEPITKEVGRKETRRMIPVAGKWQQTVNFEESAREIMLHPDGKINKGPATWKRKGSQLTLQWPAAPGIDGPDRQEIDTCILSPDGQWYIGRNREDKIIHGHRIISQRDQTEKQGPKEE